MKKDLKSVLPFDFVKSVHDFGTIYDYTSWLFDLYDSVNDLVLYQIGCGLVSISTSSQFCFDVAVSEYGSSYAFKTRIAYGDPPIDDLCDLSFNPLKIDDFHLEYSFAVHSKSRPCAFVCRFIIRKMIENGDNFGVENLNEFLKEVIESLVEEGHYPIYRKGNIVL